MTQPRPTVFISYASEDRSAALRLREVLAAAGVDVWFDANELGGGDAWDQKIRRQIRECDYVLAVVSATTQRRKEGYFRREWRLAAERTLDMADDVMFLLPISIDGTTEVGARVPEKFLTVQWLYAPGGEPTPALTTLAERLAAGDHTVPPRLDAPPKLARPARGRAAPDAHEGPPPMPAFPHLEEPASFGRLMKFLAEVIWWVITAGWLLLRRAPRWIRIVLSVWFCIFLLSRCNRDRPEREREPERESEPAVTFTARDRKEAREALQQTAEQLAALANKPGSESGPGGKFAEFGAQIARNIASELKAEELSDKSIVAVPFTQGVTDARQAEFLSLVFTTLYGRLALERAGDTALVTDAPPAATAEVLTDLGKRLRARHVLGAEVTTDAGGTYLQVRLVRPADGSLAWTERYPLEGEAAALANQIATAVLAAAGE